MPEEINIDTILDWFKESVVAKQPIPPGTYLDAAMKLNILVEDVDDEITALQMEMANVKKILMEDGMSVAMAERMAEPDPRNTQLNSLKAKRKRIDEFIRLSKHRAKIDSYSI